MSVVLTATRWHFPINTVNGDKCWLPIALTPALFQGSLESDSELGSQMDHRWSIWLKMPFCGKMHRGRLGPQRLICSPLMWYHMPSSSGLIGWLLAWGSRYMKNFEIEGVSLWESKGLCVCFHGNNWCGRSQEFPVFLPTQLTRNNNNSKKQWSASILQPPSAMAVGLVSSTTKINK